MAPPQRPVYEERADEVSAWYAVYGAGYEMGTWYTMIAGLLNVLVIYDAYAGPLAVPISGRKKEQEEAESEESDDPFDKTSKGKDAVKAETAEEKKDTTPQPT